MRARQLGWYGGSFGPKAQVYKKDHERQWNEEKYTRAVARKSAKTYTNTHEILLRETGECLLLEAGLRGAKVYASLEDLVISLTLQGIDTEHLKERDKENVVDHNN